MKKNLDSFFNPKSIAVIGASHNQLKIGHVVLKNFVHGGFEGKIYPINPDTKPILDLKTYASIKDIKEPVDLAVIVVPAKIVPRVLKECGEAKTRAIVVISSGFKEIGKQGLELEKKLEEIIKQYKLTVIGPNCLGIYDADSKVDTLFLPSYRLGRPNKGNIAFISQSGAFGSAILDWAAQEGFGISKFISYGNAADVDEVDLLEYLGKDKETQVISIYLEGASRPRELMKIAEKVSRKKPVLCLKAGSSKAGIQAAQSHTGSLAGSDTIYSAAFKQSGILRVNSTEKMFDFARALGAQPLPKGNKIAVITDGGGFGVMASDFAEKENLILAEISSKTKRAISKIAPHYATLTNPIDLTGSANGQMYKVAMEACLKDRNIDGIIVILLFQPPNIESDVVQNVLEIAESAKKPILVCSAGGTYTQLHRDILDQSGIPTFPTPERVVSSMSALYKYSQIKSKPI